MKIVRVDPTHDATFNRYADIHRSAEDADGSHPVGYQPAELRAVLSDSASSERQVGYLGFDDDGVPVVAGRITTRSTDNLDKADLAVWVEPARRRRGHGSAMAEALVSLAIADGRTTLTARTRYPVGADESHPNRAFARKHGFTLANTDGHRVLDLPVATSKLDALIAAAARQHPDYSFAEYVNTAVPADLLASYLELVNALMSDSPTGEVDYESGAVTAETFYAEGVEQLRQGHTAYRTVAVDPSGRAAAHSVLAVPAYDPGNVFQWGTLVARSHRGHRLGIAVKARNLKTVQAHHPDRLVVHTWNAASNRYMIAVNEALGFYVVGETADYVRRLDA